jgi:hypothetical protein
MPLVKGSSREAVSENIKREMDAGKKQSQAVAIALDVARRAKRDAGGPVRTSWQTRNAARGMMHSGPIMSAVPGRTDHVPLKVAPGSYIVNADTVSHIGKNNTAAGHSILSQMFGKSGPFGSSTMPIKMGRGAPSPPKMPRMRADGGEVTADGDPVEIMAAGGEFTIPPEIVANIGGGDIERGHATLDHWMQQQRKAHIAELKKLPGPAKD